MLQLHLAAYLGGFFLDLLLGDPYCLPHPVRWMGKLIAALEQKWNTSNAQQALCRGRWMVLICVLLSAGGSFFLLFFAYLCHPAAGVVLEIIMSYQCLATKGLRQESMRVYEKLSQNDLEGARRAVSMIVGRDTNNLDEAGVTKAAVETVAENTSDGVIAPLFYLALGGPVLGFSYKAVNTIDSMVGYRDNRYLFFGRCGAKTDDVVNYIPSRISAGLLLLAAGVTGMRSKEFEIKRAWKVYLRDRKKHASPNAAQTESVCAGALGVQLAGNASYFGKEVKKPYIGDASRPIEPKDICRVNRLLYISAFLGVLLFSMGIVAFM